MAFESYGYWDFTPHLRRSWHGRRNLANESVIMRIYRVIDWGGYPTEEWNAVAEYTEVEIQGENFTKQLIQSLRQHMAWYAWEGERREISIRDAWFIENRLFIDFENIRIWENLGTSGESSITISLHRSLASLLDTEDIAQVVFLHNGIENFFVGGHGRIMGRLHLNNKETLYSLGLIFNKESNYTD